MNWGIIAREQISEDNIKMKKVKDKILSIKDKLGVPDINSTEVLAAREEECELARSSHPGFVISFDNLHFQLMRRNITKDSQNQDHHFFFFIFFFICNNTREYNAYEQYTDYLQH